MNQKYITFNPQKAVSSSMTLGSTLAVVLSYSVNKSILWAVLHGFVGWFYVIYFAIRY